MNIVKLTGRIAFAVLVMFGVACSTDENVGQTNQSIVNPTVTTDRLSYTPNQSITVSWTGMPGNASDWVAITTAGSPPDSGFKQFFFINGQVNGSQVFNGLSTTGNYEARMYVNNTYMIVASTTFSVNAATVTTDKPAYAVNQGITVSWTGMPGNAQDFVSINTAGSPPDSGFKQFFFINGQTSGSQAFNGLSAGNYEARMYLNNTYTILATTSFSVANATITTNSPTYSANQPITASWTGMPGNAQDWVAVARAGAPANSVLQFVFINGQTSGSQVFNGLPLGSYEARAYLNNTYTILATSPFTVTNATVTTDASSYTTSQTVTVTYSGLPGNPQDWIAIATLGSPDTSVVSFSFTGGATSGTKTFTGLAAGTYEARAYVNNTYTVLARSAAFTVSASCISAGQQRPVLGSLTSGDLVIGATQTEATAAISAPLATSILFTSMRENEPSPKYGATLCELHVADLTRPDGVTCYRTNAGTDSLTSPGTINIHWTVATFTSGVSVQRGDAQTYPTNATVTLTAVNPAQSFVLLGGMENGGTGWGNNEFVRAQLTSGTTLDVQTNVPGTTVAWQVVTMSGASVQRGSSTFATTDVQQLVPITSTPAGTMVLASYTTDNPSGTAASALMMQASLQNSSTILLKRGAGGSNLSISWEAVSLPYAVISGLTTFAAGQSATTAPVSGIAAASSVAVCSSEAVLGQSTGSTSYAGSDFDLVGEAAVTLTTTAGGVTLQRATSQAAAEIPWTVIDFAHDCTGL